MNNDYEVVPTSDDEEAEEALLASTRSKRASTVAFDDTLAVHTPVRKRARTFFEGPTVFATPSPAGSSRVQASPVLGSSQDSAQSAVLPSTPVYSRRSYSASPRASPHRHNEDDINEDAQSVNVSEFYHDSQSQDPLDLLTHSPHTPPSPPPLTTPISEHAALSNSQESIALTDHPRLPSTPSLVTDNEDLMDFGPSNVGPSSILNSPGPTTPSSGHNGGNSPLTSPPSTPPRPPVAHMSPPPEPNLVDLALFEEKRYSFRDRKAQQLHPYRYDDVHYKYQMKDVPEAIVKGRPTHNHGPRNDNYEQETQEVDDEDTEHVRRARRKAKSHSRSRSRGSLSPPPGLPALSDSDNDGEESRFVRKEDQILAKRKRQRLREEARQRKEAEELKKQEEEERQRRKKAKGKDKQSTSREPSVDQDIRQSSSPPRRRRRTPDFFSRPGPSTSRLRTVSPISPGSNIFNGHSSSLSPGRQTPDFTTRHHITTPSPRGASSPIHVPGSDPLDPPNFDDFAYPDPAPLSRNSSQDILQDITDEEPTKPPQSESPANTSEDDGGGGGDTQSSEEEQSEEDPDAIAAQKRLKILGRMYPAFMVNKLGKDAAAKKASRDKRKQVKAKSQRKSSKSDSTTGLSGIGEEPRPPQPFDADDDLLAFAGGDGDDDILEISDDSDAEPHELINIEDSSDSEMSDSSDRPQWAPTGREPDIIDYMLVRGRRLGRGNGNGNGGRRKKPAASRARPRSSKAGPSHPRRRERQTRLTEYGSSIRKGTDTRARRDRERAGRDLEDEAVAQGVLRVGTHLDRSRKESSKRRKENQAKNGVYVFGALSRTHLTNGRDHRARAADLELDDALEAPSEKSLFKYRPRAPRDRQQKPPKHRLQERHVIRQNVPIGITDEDDDEVQPPVPLSAESLTFAVSTYIGKGWLYELTRCRCPDEPLPEPIFCSFGNINFSVAAMEPDAFVASLNHLLHSLFDAHFGLPDEDHDVILQNCPRLFRSATVLLTYLIRRRDEASAKLLNNSVLDTVARFVARLQDVELDTLPASPSMWLMLWLPIELCVRIGVGVPTKLEDGNLLQDACEVLIARLLSHGVGTSLKSGTVDKLLHPTELWVCLFQSLTCDPIGDKVFRGNHLVWQLVTKILEANGCGDMSPLKMSEHVWSIIFTLSELSSLTVHGRPTTNKKSATGWDAVHLALQCISFDMIKPTAGVPSSNAILRDKYIASVIRNCFQLHHEYRWDLSDVYPVLRRLLEAFKVRGFASLAHEEHHFPSFIRRQKWNNIDILQREDTAYVVYLKLLNQARHFMTSAEVTKIFSASIPSGPLRFNKRNPPSQKDLSNLTNRYVAMIISVYVFPASHKSRIQQACGYAKFEDADNATRLLLVQGFISICQVLLQCELPLTGVMAWLEEMIQVVIQEYDPALSEDPDDNPTLMSTRMLMRGVTYVLGGYDKVNMDKDDWKQCIYPDPKLLDRACKIIRDQKLRDEAITRVEFVSLVHAFFKARAWTVPPSRNAPAVPEDSQNEFDFDLDLNDPTILAALDGSETPPVSDYKELDKRIVGSLELLFWRILDVCTSLVHAHTSMATIDTWLETWATCTAILVDVQPRLTNWKTCWETFNGKLAYSDAKNRYIRCRLVWFMLKADPQAYHGPPTLQDEDMPLSQPRSATNQGLKLEVLGVVFVALVTARVNVEHELLAAVLAVDGGTCPLFANIPFDRQQDGTYEVVSSDFEDRRAELIEGAFTVLDDRLGDDEHKTETMAYVDIVIQMFSRMRAITMDLDQSKDTEMRGKYHVFCKTVMKSFRECPRLSDLPRLAAWVGWARTMED